MVTSPSSPTSDRATELAECGWRVVTETQPDGTITFTNIPLTPEEFLHPQEGFHLPNSTFHDDIAGYVKDILTRRYANDPTVGIFRDLLIEWNIVGQGNLCPDTFVAFGIKNKDQNRSTFIVANEGVRPSFVLEVVSPRYRKQDRETKVVEYARTRVQEYVIVDRRRRRKQWVEEVLGYRLTEGIYQAIVPDEEGRIRCDTVGLLMSFQEGCLIVEDAETGERLLSSLELETANQELETANQELETANQELETAKKSAQQQAEEMAAQLERYRERFGDLSDRS
ncbi:MAG: Uma2 family endonuclease [Cyanobacteriota bacterium]|nr:Uma2 family endonuclease [Cyanobacteriota bacterium]